jgi:hypothetical protein
MEEENMIIILTKPYTFEGVEHQKLNCDFDRLIGDDFIKAESEARLMGDRNMMLESSKLYQACVVAKAAKVPVDLIKSLPGKDFNRVTVEAQNFLLG